MNRFCKSTVIIKKQNDLIFKSCHFTFCIQIYLKEYVFLCSYLFKLVKQKRVYMNNYIIIILTYGCKVYLISQLLIKIEKLIFLSKILLVKRNIKIWFLKLWFFLFIHDISQYVRLFFIRPYAFLYFKSF